MGEKTVTILKSTLDHIQANRDELACKLEATESALSGSQKICEQFHTELESAEQQLRDTQASLREHMRYIRYLVDHHSATCKHKSDCALHNMPAYKNMPCDCGLYPEF